MKTTISPALRAQYPRLTDHFDEVEARLSALLVLVGDPLSIPKTLIRTPDGMARKLARGHLLRCFDLANGAINCVNSGSIQAAFGLVRGLYESFAAIHHAESAFQRTRDSGSKKELMDEIIPRIAFGNRYMKGRGDDDFPESVNVMTAIQKADQFLSRLLSKRAGETVDSEFLTNYEFLSEFAHPAQGSLSFYETSDPDNWHYSYEPRERDIAFVCGQVALLAGIVLIVHESFSQFTWQSEDTDHRDTA